VLGGPRSNRSRAEPQRLAHQGVDLRLPRREIENPLTQKARYLDKLVDELARGKKMENILRS